MATQNDLFPADPVRTKILAIGRTQERFDAGDVICALNGGCWGGDYWKETRAVIQQMVWAFELIERRVYFGSERPGAGYRGFGYEYQLMGGVR